MATTDRRTGFENPARMAQAVREILKVLFLKNRREQEERNNKPIRDEEYIDQDRHVPARSSHPFNYSRRRRAPLWEGLNSFPD